MLEVFQVLPPAIRVSHQPQEVPRIVPWLSFHFTDLQSEASKLAVRSWSLSGESGQRFPNSLQAPASGSGPRLGILLRCLGRSDDHQGGNQLAADKVTEPDGGRGTRPGSYSWLVARSRLAPPSTVTALRELLVGRGESQPRDGQEVLHEPELPGRGVW